VKLSGMIRHAAFTSIALVCVLVMGQTSQPRWQKTPQGWLILRSFENAPYPHPSRQDGFKGKSASYPRDPHYTDPTVGIFIPDGYVDSESVNYVVHFHGHTNHVS
jgi:hypothetical protein